MRRIQLELRACKDKLAEIPQDFFDKRPRLHFSIFTMSDLIEQRIAIKFWLQKRWGCCGRPLVILPCRRKIFISGTKTSKNVRERVDDLKRSGRPSTSTNDQHVNKVKCSKIVGWLLKALLICSEYQKDLWKLFWNHRPFEPTKSQISFGTEKAQFLANKVVRDVDVCETMLSDYQDKLKCIITG